MLDYGTIWWGTLLVCPVAPPSGGQAGPRDASSFSWHCALLCMAPLHAGSLHLSLCEAHPFTPAHAHVLEWLAAQSTSGSVP